MPRAIDITNVMAGENDNLYIEGVVDDVPARAQGWQSAVTNYFPPECYGEPDINGQAHRLPNSTSRNMTHEEATAYFIALLDAAVPQPEQLQPFNYSLGRN